MDIRDIDLRLLIENETGQKFNRENKICCPMHHENSPSFSIRFNSDHDKWQWKCFGGCNASGDAIDFIMKYKNIAYKEAREYLGMENKKSEKELALDKIKGFIDWQIEKTEYKQGYKIKGIFTFVNEKNEVVYYKAKFLKPDGKKASSYYHFEGEKIVNSRGTDEIPYNLYNVLKAIENGKTLIFVEGEKDANTVNDILKGTDYIATSIKGCTNLDILRHTGMRIYIIKDTGEAGEQYGWKIYKEFRDISEEFKFIKLPGIKALGDNKDVTDWLEAGHDKEGLINAFDRSLDIKSRYELQQNKKGIYKHYFDKKDEEWKKIHLTDFKLIEAKRMRFVDDDQEGVKLVLRSCTGEIIEKIGPSTVFDDTKTFKNFLGTLDLAFKGKVDDLTDLKSWINKFWAIENEEIYQGLKFIKKDDQLMLITNEGAISQKGVEPGIKSDNTNGIDIIGKDHINATELSELRKRIFKFASSDKSIPIIGTIINNLAVYQNQEAKEKLHHLLIVGESGSGKSTILANVVAAILNFPVKDIKSVGLITSFALIKDLSYGNYPSLFDEFKPSALDRYKIQKLSESLRNLYDRTTISRGDKSFKTRDFQLTRPLILAGEESYPNQEKALIERSCIVYLSKRERTEEHTKAMKWLIDNEKLLNKFGVSLIHEILNLSTEDYKEIRNRVKESFNELSNRPLTTAINIATGIEIYNLLLIRNKLNPVVKYEKCIIQNINEEILEGGEDTKSTVEQMIILYNSMIEDGRAQFPEDVIKKQGDGLFIRTSEMINQIFDFVKKLDSAEVVPLKLRDFKKQAAKAGYIKSTSSKVIKVTNKTIRFDEYNRERMQALNIPSIIEPDFTLVTHEDGKVIGGVF